MCGRYTLTRQDHVIDDLQATLGMSAHGEWWRPRFNVAPTQPVPVVVRGLDGNRTVELMRWGLLPHWSSRDGVRPPLMINARSESLMAKAVFRDALAHKRCLVAADGFFEWMREAGAKPRPIYFHPAARRVFAFAGLWARVRTDTGDRLSFTIITGKPNELVAPVHDRMPVVLDPSRYDAWLDPTLDVETARALLATPRPVDDWRGEPVSTRVNTATHDDPACIAPEVAAPQRSLFD